MAEGEARSGLRVVLRDVVTATGQRVAKGTLVQVPAGHEDRYGGPCNLGPVAAAAATQRAGASN